MAFQDIQFPSSISYGSEGGPKYSVTIVKRQSGNEIRNLNWTYPLHEYNVATGIKQMSDLESVIDFFHIMEGPTHGFRFKDWADYKTSSHLTAVSATDIEFGLADGTTTWQLIKKYTNGAYTKTRNITRPIANTVRVSVNGAEQTSPGWTYPWSVNDATGILTWTGTVPGSNLSMKWGGEFDVPCRFASDTLSTNLASYNIGQADIRIIEIRA